MSQELADEIILQAAKITEPLLAKFPLLSPDCSASPRSPFSRFETWQLLPNPPPIEVYQISETCLMLDSNHWGSVTWQFGATHIEADSSV